MPRRAERPLLFVYGTLMRGEPAHRLLLGRATFLEEGHTSGVLLDLGRFPGVIEGPGRVGGEVWRLDRPELLQTLDDYEGYNFHRCRAAVTLANGRRVRCWIYFYRESRGPNERIPSTAHAVDHRVVRRKVIPEGHWRRYRWR